MFRLGLNPNAHCVTNYQISQQQAIYDRITNLTSSFDTLLKLHERSPAVKNKLDSVMARLDRLCSLDGDDGVSRDEDEHERRAMLFNTLRPIVDNTNTLYNRINAQGYEECQDDILAASGIAEDIRDALLEHQTIYQWATYEQNCRLIDMADLAVLNSCRRAHGAGYQHGDRRGCLRGTRETVLNEIELWAEDFDKSPVFWLNGLAGTGKSTIAQTISERIFADGLLGASFFCSRDFKDRSDLHLIFPTLAFQLAHKYLEFRSILVPLLQLNPDVVHESLYSQMRKLIVEPLSSADISTVIVIDALDECKDEEPSSAILSVLGRLAGQIPKVKFFITGRPEPRIKTGFRLPLLEDVTDVFVLHDVHPSVINNDIRLFLQHELSELAQRRRIKGWPSDECIDLLSQRAAGLFVYAVATIKFLDNNAHLPKKRLDAIVNLPESTNHEGKTRFNSKTTLDSLYMSILEAAFDEQDPEVYSKVRSTIGAVVLLVNPLPPSGIAELVGLDPDEVTLFLTLVQSLLAFDEDIDQPVKPFHKSFPDFITDPSRCLNERFHVSPRILHLELAISCLRVMNAGLERNLLSLPDYALNAEVDDLRTRIEDRISVALRYASQSWHNHLAMTQGDVADVISQLRIFLEEKFLAWLEVASVLRAVRGAVVALEQLMSWIREVARDEKLLDIAKDCFYFVTRSFEPISVSATHVYHSALELSPASSIVRELYYHRRPTPFPRVAVEMQDTWHPSITISSPDYYESSAAWSTCGRFVAIRTKEAVEIRDPLTFGLLSTLHPAEPASQLVGVPAYSPDGRSFACASDAAIVIWDIQTGGVAKEFRYNTAPNESLVWSSDGRSISTTASNSEANTLTVGRCDIASGTASSHITLQSEDKTHFWAHGESFRVMTTAWDGATRTIGISEIGPTLTTVESFPIQQWGSDWTIESFSPATYRISVSSRQGTRQLILDVRNSENLLDRWGTLYGHCFSPDGSLFAGFDSEAASTWKYDNGRYIAWRQLPTPACPSHSLLFSPTSSSILVNLGEALKIWYLDDLTDSRIYSLQLAVFSRSGSYLATARWGGCTVTIVNLISQTPSQLIDVDDEICGLGFTGNVLLVVGFRTMVAWLLTEGTVSGISGNRRADHGDSIWTVVTPWVHSQELMFSVEGETGIIKSDGNILRVYNTGTGEVLEPAKAPLQLKGPWYSLLDLMKARCYLYDGSVGGAPPGDWKPSKTTLKEGWMKDCEGRCLLWVPVEWRTVEWTTMEWNKAKRFSDIATIRFEPPMSYRVLIRLY